MELLSGLTVRSGYFAASSAFKDMKQEDIAEATVVVIGCG